MPIINKIKDIINHASDPKTDSKAFSNFKADLLNKINILEKYQTDRQGFVDLQKTLIEGESPDRETFSTPGSKFSDT